MFASEDEKNLYAGMVARGRSSYIPPGQQRSTASISSTAEARSAEPGFVPALERRSRSTFCYPPRTSSSVEPGESHEPFPESQPVNITPILLRAMEMIIRVTSDASAANRINRNQAALASRRMKLISSTLRQMPHPAPSQRLLTALQSLCLLVRQCGYDAAEEDAEAMERIRFGPGQDPLGPAQCWPVLLCQHFTCRLLFRGAYRRLWSAWRMYSPTKLEREDAVAEAKDREVDMAAMLCLLFAAGDVTEVEAKLTSAVAAQHRHDMVAYYQRREMSSWRVYAQQLRRTRTLIRGGERRGAAATTAAEEEEDVYRFRALPEVYLYRNVPVVVKALCAAKEVTTGLPSICNGGSAAEEAAMTHAADFLQDVACRCLWVHPHIVGCIGAYTERFVSTTTDSAPAKGEERVMDENGEADAELHEQQSRSSPAAAAVVASADTTNKQESGFPWSRPADVLSGTPVMALGFITELQTAAIDASTPCQTLGDLLFSSPHNPPQQQQQSVASGCGAGDVTRYYFTIPEALDICAQLADGLQYILEDGGDVPAAVRTSWLTLDPFNIYVVRVIGGDGGASAVQTMPHLPIHQGGKRGTASTPAAATHNASVAFSQHSSFSTVSNAMPATAGELSKTVSETPKAVVQNEAAPPLQPVQQLAVHVDPSPDSIFSSSLNVDGVSPLVADHATGAALSAAAAVTNASPPPRGSQRFIVRYCPSADWTGRVVGSRWRPHPRATAPASYVLAQLLLALLTRQPPYAAYKSDREVQRRVFGSATDIAQSAGVQVKLGNGGQGYAIPSSLPPSLALWCRQALSLDRSQPPKELESLRDALATLMATLQEVETPATAVSAPATIDAATTRRNPAASREMSARF